MIRDLAFRLDGFRVPPARLSRWLDYVKRRYPLEADAENYYEGSEGIALQQPDGGLTLPAADRGRKYVDVPPERYRRAVEPKDAFFRALVADLRRRSVVATRSRLLVMTPGGELPFHTDVDAGYEETYRLHIPLATNAACSFKWRVGGRVLGLHLPADGSAYLLNVGATHSFENRGATRRYHFICCPGRWRKERATRLLWTEEPDSGAA